MSVFERECVCGYSCTVDNRLDGFILCYGSDRVIFILQHKLEVISLSNIFHSAVSLQICFEVFLRFPSAHHVMKCYVHTCGRLLACTKISEILRCWIQQIYFTVC